MDAPPPPLPAVPVFLTGQALSELLILSLPGPDPPRRKMFHERAEGLSCLTGHPPLLGAAAAVSAVAVLCVCADTAPFALAVDVDVAAPDVVLILLTSTGGWPLSLPNKDAKPGMTR